MCGIFYSCRKSASSDNEVLIQEGKRIKHRGPDNMIVTNYKNHLFMFHRLCINDLSDDGNQPFNIDDCILICNGEIYNAYQLNKTHGFNVKSKSDCETIIHMYRKFGIQWTIDNLDGVFAFVLYDIQTDTLYVGRDRVGVRSLYFGYSKNRDGLSIGSEIKSLHNICKDIYTFPPGSYGVMENTQELELYDLETTRYHQYDYPEMTTSVSESDLCSLTRFYLKDAVKKRLMSDRPIGCFLSGGLDSSLITALVAEHYERGKLATFSVGLEDSPDLIYARMVANHLGTDHHEIIVTEQQMIDAIPDVIRQIESYDTTSVRASVPMYLMSKYVKENTDVTVVYSGEGSDEASGSYLYFHNAPNEEEFTKEAKRLVMDLNRFDVLRCDKTTAGHSLEVRVPFLDKEFMKMYMSIPASYKKVRQMENGKWMEKYLLRKAFDYTVNGQKILPDEVLWRTKEALSDGVSKNNRSWYEIINEYLQDKPVNDIYYKHNTPTKNDQKYFRDLFEEYYPGREELIPYYWLPKWSGDSGESSARKLGVYSSVIDN